MTDTLSGQDERRALADRLAKDQEWMIRHGRVYSETLLKRDEVAIILAALRAEPARGEEMRERAAKVCDEEARDQHDFWLRAVGDGDEVGIHMADAAEEAAKELAAAIRALPAQGGEDA